MKRALPGQIRQFIRCRPVDVALARREPRPATFWRHRHAWRHIVGDDRAQLAPAALASDDHRVAVGDAARRRVGRADLDEGRALLAIRLGWLAMLLDT